MCIGRRSETVRISDIVMGGLRLKKINVTQSLTGDRSIPTENQRALTRLPDRNNAHRYVVIVEGHCNSHYTIMKSLYFNSMNENPRVPVDKRKGLEDSI